MHLTLFHEILLILVHNVLMEREQVHQHPGPAVFLFLFSFPSGCHVCHMPFPFFFFFPIFFVGHLPRSPGFPRSKKHLKQLPA